jgi:hypothetical protein
MFRLLLVLLLAVPAAARAQLPPLEVVGVQVEKAVGDGRYSHGSGVLLDGSLVLTAAHVIAYAPDNPSVTVLVDGRRVGAVVAYDGRRAELDLALLRLDTVRAGAPPVALCPENPPTSAAVLVAGQGAVSPTRTVNTPITSKAQMVSGWTNLLDRGFDHGTSGGGVFDPKRGCLWGIVTTLMAGPSLADGHHLEFTAVSPALEVKGFLDSFRASR